VANKPKAQKTQDRDRRAKVEAMRREQQARERRKSLLFIVIAVVVGLGIVAAAAVPSYLKSRNDPAKKALSSFGVDAGAADCSDVETKDGTNTEALRAHDEDGKVEKYATVPPSYGPHWGSPVFPARTFYTARDRPDMEQLVHNLEHGYTILWYDETVANDDDQMLELRAVADKLAGTSNFRTKFIAAPWTSEDEDGKKFPDGQHIAFSHWSAGGEDAQDGKQVGVWQYCSDVSGAALKDFMLKYPYTDSPEPAAA
jgi:hypothetical protein